MDIILSSAGAMNVKRNFPDGFMLRFPEGMRDDLKRLAAQNGRSLNAEIIQRLEQSLNTWPNVVLPNDLVDRALKSSPDRRSAFEANLLAEATRLAEQFFPEEALSFIGLYHALDAFLVNVPDAERAKIKKALDKVVTHALSFVPQETMDRVGAALETLDHQEEK